MPNQVAPRDEGDREESPWFLSFEECAGMCGHSMRNFTLDWRRRYRHDGIADMLPDGLI